MRPDDIKTRLRQQPFKPFRVHLSNGHSYEVRHPELAMVGRTTMLIGQATPGMENQLFEDFIQVDVIHINDIEPMSVSPPPSGNGPAITKSE